MDRTTDINTGTQVYAPAAVHGWTFDTVIQFLGERDRRYTERFAAVSADAAIAMEATEKAVIKADVANNKQFEGVPGVDRRAHQTEPTWRRARARA
jgi:hypothetical protein